MIQRWSRLMNKRYTVSIFTLPVFLIICLSVHIPTNQPLGGSEYPVCFKDQVLSSVQLFSFWALGYACLPFISFKHKILTSPIADFSAGNLGGFLTTDVSQT